MATAPPPVTPLGDADVDEVPAEERVHHHARLDDPRSASAGEFITLCGLRVRRRPDAASMPCCPMCAASMGGPCKAGR